MIAYINGTIEYIGEKKIIIENNGIGYEILVPDSVTGRIGSTGKNMKIYTYLHVREDIMQLFGFLSRDELEIFKLLITVSGIGPKGGLSILSAMSADDIRFAVLAGDAKAISKAPGIGNKTAGKLILELKDKLNLKDTIENALDKGEAAAGVESISADNYTVMRNDAIQALTALGYNATDALKAVRKVEMTEDMTTEKLLKESLKMML